MTDIDAMLDRMHLADAIERCTDKGVKERPPIKNVAYAGHVVQRRAGIPLAMAIVHRVGERFVIDLVRTDVSIAECVSLLQRYGARVSGAVGDEADCLADAVAGAIAELRKGALQ